MGILKLENVCYRYKDAPKDSYVFKNINYDFEEGKMYAIKGKSGSGKTTLLSLITGLENCTEGQILYDGKELKKMNLDTYRNTDIGIVFQDSRLIEEFTVFYNIALPGYICRESADVKKSVYSLLERFGISDLELSHPSELSSGQKQRVAMARALVNNPKVLFLDEPTGNLDIESGKSIYAFLQDINRQGKTIVMVTHDI
mgnify:CR=1 FL=1